MARTRLLLRLPNNVVALPSPTELLAVSECLLLTLRELSKREHGVLQMALKARLRFDLNLQLSAEPVFQILALWDLNVLVNRSTDIRWLKKYGN